MSNLPVKHPETALNLLSEDEKSALLSYQESGADTHIGPSLAASLFELFLNGKSIKEIQAINKAFSVGMIVDARLRYKWDEQKEEYVRNLFLKIRERAEQAHAQSVHHLIDRLSATHKLTGDRLQKFLQTGDESLIAGMQLSSMTNYSKVIQLLMSMLGQDKKGSSINLSIQNTPNATASTDIIGGEKVQGQLLPSGTAAQIIKALLETKK